MLSYFVPIWLALLIISVILDLFSKRKKPKLSTRINDISIQPISTVKSESPVEGQMYYDTKLNKVCIYKGNKDYEQIYYRHDIT